MHEPEPVQEQAFSQRVCVIFTQVESVAEDGTVPEDDGGPLDAPGLVGLVGLVDEVAGLLPPLVAPPSSLSPQATVQRMRVVAIETNAIEGRLFTGTLQGKRLRRREQCMCRAEQRGLILGRSRDGRCAAGRSTTIVASDVRGCAFTRASSRGLCACVLSMRAMSTSGPPPPHPPYPGHPSYPPHPAYPQGGPHGFQPQPMKPSWLARNGILLLLPLIPVIVAGVHFSQQAQLKANYLLFDSADADVAVKVDGKSLSSRDGKQKTVGPSAKDSFGGRAALWTEVKPGKHRVEILDAAGKVLETAEIDVPASRFRAVYAAGKPRGYALVSVGYGGAHEKHPFVELTQAANEHVFVFPPEPETRELDFGPVNRKFKASIYSKNDTILRSLCTLSDEGEVECELEEKPPPTKRRR